MKHNNEIDLAYEFVKEPEIGAYEYVYRGRFNDDITNHILRLTEAKLSKKRATRTLRKRISFVIIENLQNISRHQDMPDDNSKAENCLFILHITDKAARIVTGNFVETRKQKDLEAKIQKVVLMDGESLKNLYRKTLTDSKISEKGGAGLGLISMGRRTDGHIRYRFVKVDEQMSFFYIQNQLTINGTEDNLNDEDEFFERMIAYHQLLAEENILLNFRGAFAFDNVEVLLPVINSQAIGGFGQKRTIYNISVNLIRNIVLYADSKNEAERKRLADDADLSEDDTPGVYTLSRKDGLVKIMSGNYISNSKVLILKNKIDLINRTGTDGLLKIRNYLSNFYPDENVGRPDISLIDMKLTNDDRPIVYRFSRVDELRSFFTIQIEV